MGAYLRSYLSKEWVSTVNNLNKSAESMTLSTAKCPKLLIPLVWRILPIVTGSAVFGKTNPLTGSLTAETSGGMIHQGSNDAARSLVQGGFT
jgi:hypothetical protein